MILSTTDIKGKTIVINLNHVSHAIPITLPNGREGTCFYLAGERRSENEIRTTAKFTDVRGYWSNYTI